MDMCFGLNEYFFKNTLTNVQQVPKLFFATHQSVANQRKKVRKGITVFDWEHNVERLRELAKRQNKTLSQLLRERTKQLLEENGYEYREDDER